MGKGSEKARTIFAGQKPTRIVSAIIELTPNPIGSDLLELFPACSRGVVLSTIYFFIFTFLSLFFPLATFASGVETGGAIGLLDAARSTLLLQPEITIQEEQVNLSRSILQSTAGDFDLRLQASARFEENNSPSVVENRDTTILNLSLIKQFRSGPQLISGLELTKVDQQPSSADEFQNASRITFQVVIPLLKGFGQENVASREISAAYELEASQNDLLHRVSLAVLDTTLAYWDFVASYQRLTIFQQSEDRARLLAEKTEDLIQAEQLPASDIKNVLANLADKASMRIAAEQVAIETRFALGISMGTPAAVIAGLPAPKEKFPQLKDGSKAKMVFNFSTYTNLAMSKRSDLRAEKRRVEAINAQIKASRNRLKPRLDLGAMGGYNGFSSGSRGEDYIDALKSKQGGMDWSVGLNFEYNLGNNLAKGNLEQDLVRYRQKQVQIENQARIIVSNVMVVVNSLTNVVAELEKLDESAQAYSEAVENERLRFQMGEATLLDFINIQDRMDSVLLNRISTRQRLAGSLVQLRFETGTLVRSAAEGYSLDLAELTTLPARR